MPSHTMSFFPLIKKNGHFASSLSYCLGILPPTFGLPLTKTHLCSLFHTRFHIFDAPLYLYHPVCLRSKAQSIYKLIQNQRSILKRKIPLSFLLFVKDATLDKPCDDSFNHHGRHGHSTDVVNIGYGFSSEIIVLWECGCIDDVLTRHIFLIADSDIYALGR